VTKVRTPFLWREKEDTQAKANTVGKETFIVERRRLFIRNDSMPLRDVTRTVVERKPDCPKLSLSWVLC
jgi:hypothetical protein